MTPYINRIDYNDWNSINSLSSKPYPESYFKLISELSLPLYTKTPRALSQKYNLSQLDKIYDGNKKLSIIAENLSNHFKENTSLEKIDKLFYKECCKHSVFPSVFGFESFPKACNLNVNEIVCHSLPSSRKLKSGDIVTFDICGYNGFFHSDMAETYCIGEVHGHHKKLVDCTKDCLFSAINICKPGRKYNEIGRIITKVTKENGFSLIEKFGGHSIGKYLHMPPYIQNHYDPNNTCEMKVGDMFCIEPLLTTGNGKIQLDKDGFGYITKDKEYVAHFERTILITDNGHEILNQF